MLEDIPTEPVNRPGWRTIVTSDQKTWIRADDGGLVEMHYDRGDLVYEGDTVCSISSPFKTDVVDVEVPFTGLLVGKLENPVVYPGNPLIHLVELDEPTRRAYERERTGTMPERPE